MESKTLKNLASVCCIIIAFASLALIFPYSRELILNFGERLLRRPFNYRSVWNIRLVTFGFTGLGLSGLLFASTKKKIGSKMLMLIGLTVLCIIETCSFIAVSYAREDITWGDFDNQWKFCAYTLHGINPFLHVGSQIAPIEEIGIIPEYWSTSPWGLILSNIFYPGFLSIGIGRIYYVVLCVVTTIAVSLALYKETQNEDKLFRVFAVSFPLYTVLLWLLPHANCSRIMICLAILVCLYSERQIFSGILLGIILIKPQLAGLICLEFLFQKKFKALVIAALIDFLAWGAASLLTKTAPLMLLKDFLAINTGGDYCYRGILTFLVKYGANSNVILLINMILGVVFVTAFHFVWGKDDSTLGTFFAFFPAWVATNFWSYQHLYDRAMLFIPVMFFAYTLFCSTDKNRSRFCATGLIYCTFFYTITTILGMCIYAITREEQGINFDKTIYDFGLIAISIIFVALNKKNALYAKTDTPRA